MKIAFVDFIGDPAKPGSSGLSDIVWNMAAQLAARGDEVHIVAPYTTDKYPHPGVQVHRFGMPPIGYRNILGHLLIVLKAWRELRAIAGLDIIYSPEYFSTGILSVLVRDIPVVLRVPGNIYERVAHGNPFDASATLAYKVTTWLSARFCARIIATSHEMLYWWERSGVSPNRMALVPTGVDTREFRPYPAARTTLGMDPKAKIVLYCGRLSPEKGIEYLLQAVASLQGGHEDVQLHLVGDGKERERLAALAGHLGLGDRVVFHGWVPKDETPQYYSAADVCVLPSFSEGLPRVMLEALACGTVFIGTNITGVVDHIENGVNGFRVPPGDIDALSSALQMVLEHPDAASRVSQQARAYACDNLDWSVIAKRVREEVFAPLVEVQSTSPRLRKVAGAKE